MGVRWRQQIGSFLGGNFFWRFSGRPRATYWAHMVPIHKEPNIIIYPFPEISSPVRGSGLGHVWGQREEQDHLPAGGQAALVQGDHLQGETRKEQGV